MTATAHRPGAGGAVSFANQFTILAGREIITSVRIVWGRPGSPGTGVPNGTPVTVKLWSDPNGDGNPADALLLSSMVGATAASGTNTFITYDIPDRTLLVGQSFFVGGTMTYGTNVFPVGLDTTSPVSNQGWTGGGDISSNPFRLNEIAFADWMVRANGISSSVAVVPEPGTLALLAAVLPVGAAVRRRRRA